MKEAVVTCVVLALAAGGCRNAAVEDKHGTELCICDSTAPGPCITQVSVEAPLNMGVEKELMLRSQSSSELNAITVVTSCGCASGTVASTNLRPGQSIGLTLSFDPEKSLTYRRVRALVRHKGDPDEPVMIQVAYSNTEALDRWKVVPTPAALTIEAPWSAGYTHKWKATLSLGEAVSPESLSVSESSPLIRSVIRKGARPHTATLEVELHDLPVGKINEYVRVRVPRDRDSYFAAIPVAGELLSPFFCDPATITATRDKKTGKATAAIKVIRRGAASVAFPRILVGGDWKLTAVKTNTDNQREVWVESGDRDADTVGYGTMRLSGDWKGADIIVPLTAVSVK